MALVCILKAWDTTVVTIKGRDFEVVEASLMYVCMHVCE